MIEIKALTKRFGSLAAVDHLDLEIKPGVVGLVGHNGAGKSTLFRLIADVLQKDEGEILIDGTPCDQVEAKKKLFFLSDNPPMPANSTAKALFQFYDNFFDIDYDKFTALQKKFALPMERRINNFSKGMKRQLFLCLALSVRNEYLLLDEAFDGIDPVVLEYIKEEIIKLAEEGKTIVVSSHNIASLDRLVDRFVILYKGKLTKEGEEEHLSQDLVKFQCVSRLALSEAALEGLGLKVVSFKKIGSIYHFVVLEAPELEK
ncbi:MAG: ATP-binding cassette domain-containing protein, partial [Bacilli bacterium]|nr:ATP-binding cassette domain-containing protein [Bacilli bacterium]